MMMTWNWEFLIPALALLWTPGWGWARLLTAVSGSRRGHDLSFRGIFLYPGNWLDFLRAALGTWLFLQFAYEVPEPEAARAELITQAIVFGVGLVAQLPRYRHGWVVSWPVFYLSGITLFLPGTAIGALAVTAGWLLALALNDPRLQLPIMGITVAVGGFLVYGVHLPAALTAALIFGPLALTFLFRHPVLIDSHAARRS